MAVVVSFAKAYPLVFLLYPRLSVATLNWFFKCITKNSTIGDFPVPPTERLPTQINGKPNEVDLNNFLSYIQFRMAMTIQKIKAKGRRRMRNDFKNQLENISPLRCDTKV